jgi:hypothetical protein
MAMKAWAGTSAATAIVMGILSVGGTAVAVSVARGAILPNRTRRPRRVEVAGDSLSVQTRSWQLDDLRAAGFAPRVDAEYSQPIQSPWIQDHVHQSVADGNDITVVESASNDALGEWNLQATYGWASADALYRAQLERTVDELDDQCTVLVDARDAPSAGYHLPEAAPHVDAIIDQVAAEHPDVVVVPWSDLSRDHDDWFWTDGVHFADPNQPSDELNPVGAHAFAGAITDGVERCAAERGRHR